MTALCAPFQSQDASPPSLPEGHAYIDPPAVEGEDQVLQVLQGVSLCGLCPVALAQRGALVLAQLRLGLVQVDATGQVLGFSSAQALSEFAADPAGVMAQVEAAALQQPLLAKVLGLSSLHPLLNVQVSGGAHLGALRRSNWPGAPGIRALASPKHTCAS